MAFLIKICAALFNLTFLGEWLKRGYTTGLQRGTVNFAIFCYIITFMYFINSLFVMICVHLKLL